MTIFRKLPLVLLASAALVTGASAQRGAERDLFAFSEGTRIVQYPEDAPLHYMYASPLNLIDGTAQSDWTGESSPPPVFVLELPERTELSRIAFDTGPLNRAEKEVRAVTVEISDTSATSGFELVMSGNLKRARNDQSFSFDPEHLPVGRWVRLTVLANHDPWDYSALTGFRGYGRQLTATAGMPDVTGTYEGHSGWGTLHLTQQGDQVTGCYTYQNGRVSGVVNGRTMTLSMIETETDGSTSEQRAYFGMSRDGRKLIGIGRRIDAGEGYSDYYAADRINNRGGGC